MRTGKVALSTLFRRAEKCLWDAGIEAGLPRFLELANLLFLKLLAERKGDGLWERLKREECKMRFLNRVIIPHLQECWGVRSLFPPTKIAREDALEKLIAIVGNQHLGSFRTDILGDAFEYFLRNHAVSRQNLGQHFTPRPLARVMANLAAPTIDDIVYDPFCGAGGLLVEAFSHIMRQGFTLPKHVLFFGKDCSPAIRAAQMNAILHWGNPCGMEQVANTLAAPVQQRCSLGLTNVPFGRDPNNAPFNGLYRNGLAKNKTDVLCILHLFEAIRTGGRMVAIVPEGFLLGTERAPARRFLTDNANLKLVISLPCGIFPHTRTKPALVYLSNIRRPNRQDGFWYLDADCPRSLNILETVNINGTPEEKLANLGFVKIPMEKARRNDDVWMGKHYASDKPAPSRYPLVPLGEVVKFTSTGFAWKAGHLVDSNADGGIADGIPLFTSKALANGLYGGMSGGVSSHTRLLKAGTEVSEKHRCREGDILIAVKDKNRRAPLLGQAMVAPRNGVFSSELVKAEIRDPQTVSAAYLCHCFRSAPYIQEIKRFAAGSIMKGISLKDMAAIKIPLPSLPLQREAVEEAAREEAMVIVQQEAVSFLQKKHQERLNGLWG